MTTILVVLLIVTILLSIPSLRPSWVKGITLINLGKHNGMPRVRIVLYPWWTFVGYNSEYLKVCSLGLISIWYFPIVESEIWGEY